METTGTITNILPLQSGIGKSGNEWKKQDIIIQTEDNYPKTICVSLWGDMVSKGLKQGDKAQFHFNLESREFNGKWYTDVRAWKVELLNGSEQPQSVVTTDETDDLDALFGTSKDDFNPF